MRNFYKLSLIVFIGLSILSCKKAAVDKGAGVIINPPSSTKTYYVSALTGADTNIGLTTTAAFKTIAKAAALTNPGDVVLIMDGNYVSFNNEVVAITVSGTENKYITYKAMDGNHPKIKAFDNVWNAFLIDASYIIIDGLELEGDNANLTLADAQISYQQSRAIPAVFNAKYNTNAISIASKSNCNHIIVKNCKVHDFPGAGIGVSKADYVTIEGNEVYNNSWFTMYATSGISFLGAVAIDALTTYKMIIRGNKVYNNKCQIFWRTASGNDRLSDGNGIILDVNNGSQGVGVYTGRTLVENNVVFNNGGGGIHAFNAGRVDILNNTAYNNGTVVGYPEIDGQSCEDVKIYNNIMYARTGGNCNGNDSPTSTKPSGLGTVYNNNIYFNGPSFRNGVNDKTANPLFIALSTNSLSANFSLQLTSPAINAGTSVLFAPKDILGVARPKGAAVDCGAYEVN